MKPDAFHIPIRIAGLADGVHEFQMEADPAVTGLPAEFHEPLHLVVHMDKSHAHIVLRLDIHTTAVYPCDRCLKDVRIPLSESVTIVHARDAAAEHMKDDDEVRILAHDANFIDVGDDVRDVLLIAVPMRRVCADYGDNPACGADIPRAEDETSTAAGVDPRWAALTRLGAMEESGRDPGADQNGATDDGSDTGLTSEES